MLMLALFLELRLLLLGFDALLRRSHDRIIHVPKAARRGRARPQPTPPTNFDEVSQCDMKRFSAYFWAALKGGVYLPPSQYEAVFLQLGLADQDVERIGEVLCHAIASSSSEAEPLP